MLRNHGGRGRLKRRRRLVLPVLLREGAGIKGSTSGAGDQSLGDLELRLFGRTEDKARPGYPHRWVLISFLVGRFPWALPWLVPRLI